MSIDNPDTVQEYNSCLQKPGNLEISFTVESCILEISIMSISNEALQKLVQEIETQAILAQQQINVVKSQITTKNRDMRLLQLTSTELAVLPQDTRIFEGVGKMFVYSPRDDIDRRLSTETSTLKTDVENLGKKLHYLETTHKNSREHIDQIFKSRGRS